MNLSTTWLGLPLSNPLMAGASPLADDLGMVRRLEDAGSSAIVVRSLFEEQIERDTAGYFHNVAAHVETFAEAPTFLPQSHEFRLGPEQYLEHIAKVKAAVSIPVIGSLNGTTDSGWLAYAKLIEQAGADALELNIYHVATDPTESAARVEGRVLDTVRHVQMGLDIPVAVKLSPFYSSLPNLVAGIESAGAKGVVLFNRFYQPDIDIENLEATPTLHLSDSSELLLRLRWLAVLFGRTRMALACSGGVHTETDAIKALMAGASAVQVVSALLKAGPERLGVMQRAMKAWLEQHEYESLQQAIGSMSLQRCPDPAAFERGNYMRILQSWRAP